MDNKRRESKIRQKDVAYIESMNKSKLYRIIECGKELEGAIQYERK